MRVAVRGVAAKTGIWCKKCQALHRGESPRNAARNHRQRCLFGFLRIFWIFANKCLVRTLLGMNDVIFGTIELENDF